MVGYRNAIIRAQEAVLKENLFRMRDAIDQYYADKGKYPTDLQALVSEGYLRKVPEDPFTRSADTGRPCPPNRIPTTRPRTRRLRREERVGPARPWTDRSTPSGSDVI